MKVFLCQNFVLCNVVWCVVCIVHCANGTDCIIKIVQQQRIGGGVLYKPTLGQYNPVACTSSSLYCGLYYAPH